MAPILVALLIPALAPQTPRFEAQTLDRDVAIGYGLAIGDVNGDGRPDILLADKQRFVWYRNPDWDRFVMVEGLTSRDNVCIAARDIDGDRRVEVAVGASWNPGETTDPEQSGSVHVLIAPQDPTERWKSVKLHHEPTTHRMQWMRVGAHDWALVVAPLHGRGNENGRGAGARILAYSVPEDPEGEWETRVLDDTMHLTHNFDVFTYEAHGPQLMLLAGKEGVRWRDDSGVMRPLPLEGCLGAGEVRYGRLPGQILIATIEPMHGNEVAVYRSRAWISNEWTRIVLDDSLNQGHSIACDDFLGIGRVQIVAGWRNPNADGRVGIRMYVPDRSGEAWETHTIDDNQMACEVLESADLDGDGKPEIVAAGRASHNLVVYWNRN